MEEGAATAVRRPGAVRGDAHRRRARAGAHGVRRGVLLGSHRHLQPGGGGHHRGAVVVRGHARRHRRIEAGLRSRLRPERPAPQRRHRGARRGRRPFAGRVTRRSLLRGAVGRSEALPTQAGGTVHHLDLPAGSGTQAAHVVGDGHACRAGPVREGLHHLHADRQHDAVGDGGLGSPDTSSARSTAPSTCPTRRVPTPRRSATRRRPTRPSGRPARRSVRPSRSAPRCPRARPTSTS